MFKKLLTSIAVLATLLLPAAAQATILFPTGGGTGSSTLSGILIGNGVAPVNSLIIGTGLSFTGTTLTATGSGSSTFGTTSISATSPLVWNTSTANLSLGTVPVANGGTNETSQTTGGVTYFDGTHITSGSNFTWDSSGNDLNITTTQSTGGVNLTGNDPRYNITATTAASTPGYVITNSSGDIGSLFVGGSASSFPHEVGFYIGASGGFNVLGSSGSSILTVNQSGNLTSIGSITSDTLGNGIVKSTSGTLTVATAGTDYVNGSGTSGDCVQWGTSNSLTDTGSACGTGSGGVTSLTATLPLKVSGSTGAVTISTLFSTTSNSGMAQGFQYVGSGGIFQTAASSSLFGFTPQPAGTYVTAVNGTANQITSSGGTTPTLSLPNHVIFPIDYVAISGSTTNSTTTNFAITGAATNCNGANALTTNSSGVVGCTAQPQGTVTAVSVASSNGFAGSSSGGATPSLTLSTTITGLLKGNGTAISAAANGTDFTLLTANTCGAGQFFNSATAAGVLGCGTPAGTTYTGTFPVIVTGSVISFGGLSTSSPIVSGQPLYATGVNTIASVASSTFLTSIGGQSSGNYLTALTGDGTASGPGSAAFTLATVNTNLGTFNNITINAKGLATAGSNIAYDTFAWPFTPVSYGNATSSIIGFTNGILIVGSSTIVGNATTTGIHSFGNVRIPSLGIAAGQFAAYDPNGVLIGTTTPINTGGSSEGVQWATTGVLSGTPTYSNGTLGVGATLTEIGTGALSVDGNAPASGDRVLVKNQASAFQNGIYVVTATGSGIASYILTRSTDYNSNTEITPGLTTYVVSGTANTDTTWAVTFTTPLTMGTTNLSYTEVSGGSAAVTSVSNSDSTLTITPTTGNVFGSLNLAHANVWSALQTFGNSTSTLFSATYASTTTFIVSGQSGCASFNSGVLTGTGSACGSGGGGSAFPFTPTNVFGVNTSATSTPISALAGLFASSTAAGGILLGTPTNITNAFSIFNAAGANVFNVDDTAANPFLGVGATSTPWGTLSVTGDGTDPLFTVATSSNTGLPNFEVDAVGHIVVSGPHPVCTTACTMGPGSDNAFRITTGTGVLTETVTFAHSWGVNAPICHAEIGSDLSSAVSASSTPTTVIISNTSLSGKDIDVICIGVQ